MTHAPNRFRASLLAAFALAIAGTSRPSHAQAPAAPATTAAPFAVGIRVDAAKATGPLKPIWRFFGADEPNYAYMKDGQKLIADIGKLAPKRSYFRAHSLLVTGDGTPALKWGSTNAYTEDANGKPVYDWTIVDRIFDTYLARGVKPYVQIGFMPQAMSVKPDPYKHAWTPTAKYDEIFTGWAYPPKDFKKWGDLAYEWAKHCVEKYGKAEVETWYWPHPIPPRLDASVFAVSADHAPQVEDYAHLIGWRRIRPLQTIDTPTLAAVE